MCHSQKNRKRLSLYLDVINLCKIVNSNLLLDIRYFIRPVIGSKNNESRQFYNGKKVV
jgi:hypothetical protein